MRFSIFHLHSWLRPSRIGGLAALLATISIASTIGAYAHDGEAHGDHETEHCEPTAEQQAAADELVAGTTASLVAFPTPEEAGAAGYEPFRGDGAVSGQGWNGAWHYVNWAYMQDDVALDPTRIESIIYGRTPAGDIQAIGAMYMMPRGETGPQIGGCLTTWHTHTLGGFTTAEMMHVWTIDLSVGPFAHEGSPYYACEALGQTGIGSGYTVAPPECAPRPSGATRSIGRAVLVSDITSFLGLTPEELQQEMDSGQSLGDIADDAGITRPELEDFLMTTFEERLDRAVDSGEISDRQAGRLFQRFERNVDRLIDEDGPWREDQGTAPTASPAAEAD